jgi:pimeloyl-ACP methyl ester carboxylesterase
MELSTWLYILPAGFVGVVSLLYFYQHKLIYFPDVPVGHRAKLLDPADFSLPPPESHMLPMRSDGVKVHVWVFVHGDSLARGRPTVVFFHGNAGNISFRNDNFRALFRECGCNVVAVEYRGFGLSEGVAGEPELRSDAVEVLDWLLQRSDIDTKRVFLFGRSIGGAVAVHLAAARPDALAGLILENTFTCIGDLVDVLMPKLGYFKFLLRNPWVNIEVVPKLRIPCLFISGGKDEMIPQPMMPRLRELYGGAMKEVLHFPEGGHMNCNMFPGYNEKISKFLKDALTQRK